MAFQTDDIVMHKTEGWYGIVLGAQENMNRVRRLDPTVFCYDQDLELVPQDEIPFKFQDLTVNGDNVEKRQSEADKVHDLVTAALFETDQIPSDRRHEIGSLLFKVRDILDELKAS